jgi:hypothetical protein
MNDRGVAIVAVTLVLVVTALLGGAIIAQTSQDVQLAERTYDDKQALYLAESAKERGYREIMNNEAFTYLDGGGNSVDGVINNVSMLGGTYDLVASTLSESPVKVVQIVGTGNTPTGTKQITVTAEVVRENVNVYNNAIFGGSGQVGGVINGNCAIYGSVHLLGDGVGAGGSSIEALDMGGTALIHNNYEGIPAELLAKVPALPTTVFGGETISTLDAKLRVKNGAVGVSGSSEIGEANIVGNSYKETMDGIYIETDLSETRWTGTAVTDGVPDPANVQSDNGTEGLYNLGDIVQMPRFDDPYTDAGGTSWATYEAYFTANALHLPVAQLTLDDTSAALTALQAAGLDVTVNGTEFTVTDGTNTFTYNPSAPGGEASLSVDGMVWVEGNLVVGEKNLDISYSGRGTIYAGVPGSDSGDIEVHSNLLPVSTFPTVDVLGFMSKMDVNLATGPGDSQVMMAGVFYGGNQINSPKQNMIAGTFVGNYFDMGINVPKIFQVPELINNLPPGMIGSDPIWVTIGFQERSWRVD